MGVARRSLAGPFVGYRFELRTRQAWLMSHVRLTPDEARRALYVDFEGRKVGPPVLLGCTTKSRVRSQLSVWQAVTEPRS